MKIKNNNYRDRSVRDASSDGVYHFAMIRAFSREKLFPNYTSTYTGCYTRIHASFYLSMLIMLVFSPVISAKETQVKEAENITIAAKRSQVLLVQPVILCDDGGKNQARYALPKKLVDGAYTKADLEFLYLDPVRWNHGKARRGEINLNTIVKEGHANGIISKDPRVVTLLFVSAVDGNSSPLGRGLQNGNICFVSLGPDGKMTDPAERAFVVAHEVGHCLGLLHTVDDPAVPDDVPNLQGGGPFAKRLAPSALHPSQVKTILASPLSLPRRYFNTASESARLLAHDAWDNSCDHLSESTIRFELSMNPKHSVPLAGDKRVKFVRKEYSSFADHFSKDEIAVLNSMIDQLEKSLGDTWPVITRVPWNFAKMKSSFCSGFPHTRGLSIVLTDRFFDMEKSDKGLAIEVLLHEKLHVIQRLLSPRFTKRFQAYGFMPVRLPEDTPSRLSLIRNPDAPRSEWAIMVDGKPMLLATSLKMVKEKPQMAQVLHPLTPVVAKPYTFTPGPAMERKVAAAKVAKWLKRFPIPTGHDDPREVAAYLLMSIYSTDVLKEDAPERSAEQQKLLNEERKLLPQLLRLTKTDIH